MNNFIDKISKLKFLYRFAFIRTKSVFSQFLLQNQVSSSTNIFQRRKLIAVTILRRVKAALVRVLAAADNSTILHRLKIWIFPSRNYGFRKVCRFVRRRQFCATIILRKPRPHRPMKGQLPMDIYWRKKLNHFIVISVSFFGVFLRSECVMQEYSYTEIAADQVIRITFRYVGQHIANIVRSRIRIQQVQDLRNKPDYQNGLS